MTIPIAVQMETFRRKSDALQNVIHKLMLRLYAKDQDPQLHTCLGFEGCRTVMTTPHGRIQGPDVSVPAPHCATALQARPFASKHASLGNALELAILCNPMASPKYFILGYWKMCYAHYSRVRANMTCPVGSIHSWVWDPKPKLGPTCA